MLIIRQICLLLIFGTCSTLCAAQFDTRAPSGLENRGLGNPQPLALEQAFPFYVSATGQHLLQVTWNPAPGHYLYKHAFAFSLQSASGDTLQTISAKLPDGLRKTDQFFGDIEAYYEAVSADIVLPADTAPDAVLLIEYQGCADWGFCYPPQRYSFALTPQAASQKIVGEITDKF